MQTAPLLIELFTEELPPKSLKKLGESFSKSIFEQLNRQGLLAPQASYKSYATPRRLAILIDQALERSIDKEVLEKLLPVTIALDTNGQPTPPLIKKLATLGITQIDITSLERAGEGKNEAFYVRITKPGISLVEGSQEALCDAIAHLPIAKTMHYQVHPGSPEALDVQFVRPVHGLVVLFGSKILPLEIFGLQASNFTFGHRFLSSGMLTISHANDYEKVLIQQGKVLPSFENRLNKISADLIKAAGELEVLMPQNLLEEVNSLVEWPAVYMCHFEKEFLEVPQECLILTMQTNQKYFALTNQDGKLVNQFLIVSNIETAHPNGIISGNERVIRPRLSDARFFFTQDRKKKLIERVNDLKKVVYHNKLGSQLERVYRIQAIASSLMQLFAPQDAQLDTLVTRAVLLMKADLLTDMVGEFPELQGTMGTYYASHDGEDTSVALACSEHYYPRFAGDILPSTTVGTICAIADKLETLIGIWGIGLAPTGEKDPYALRRHALGVCRLLVEKNLACNLPELLSVTKQHFDNDEVQKNADLELICNFIFDRLRSYLKEVRDESYSTEEVESVLVNCQRSLIHLPEKLHAVKAFSQMQEAADLAGANKRISNILKKNELPLNHQINHELFVLEAEKDLYRQITLTGQQINQAILNNDYTQSLKVLAQISPAVNTFFADVMVNDPDIALRTNRLSLLNVLHQQMSRVADLSQLAK